MSLRAKLVAALGLLLTVGLFAFGLATYNRYASAQYDRLDGDLRSLTLTAEQALHVKAGLDNDRPGDGPGGNRLLGYAELRNSDGKTLAQLPDASNVPDIPPSFGSVGAAFTTGSAVGSGEWRVLSAADGRYRGNIVLLAIPLRSVSDSLRELVLIETIAGAALLALLTLGSWLILRRGLRPLEHMADAAGSIHAGDMSLRVAPADGRGEVGQLGLALNTMLDDLQQSFAAQQASEARLRRFLADASHELRTPLTSIQGFAEMYRIGVDNEHVDRGVIMRRIEEESTRMRTLVDDLLLLARLDERRPIEQAPVDLAVLAADACSDAVAIDATRPVTLDAPEPVMVEGVEDQLRQAVTNLVSNALSHTPAGTAVEVTAQVIGRQARLTVRDHGPGLSDEAIAHAFDRFWRADPSRVGPKAGLGLSIVAAICSAHAGGVTAANHPDGGAVFTIELPIVARVVQPAGL
jgi:two-component system, OmpR family, sensor kinase